MITKIHLRNVKGISGSFDLGKVTNLYGKNGSGKSAIIEGLQVALTGYTARGKLASKTFELSSGKAMEVTVENDQGQTLGRKFEKSGSGAKQIITLNGEVVSEKDLIIPAGFSFPSESIHPQEFLGLSGDKRAGFVFNSMGDINTLSPEQLLEKFDFFQCPLSFSEILGKLKDKKSEADKETKRCLANIQKLTGEIAELPAGNLKEWEDKKKKSQAEREKIVAEISSNAERVKLSGQRQQQIDRLTKNVGDAQAKIEASEKKITELSGKIIAIEKTRSVETVNLDINAAAKRVAANNAVKTDLEDRLDILSKKGCCPFCKSPVDALSDQVDDWDMKAFHLQAEMDKDNALLEQLKPELDLAVKMAGAQQKNQDTEREIRVERDAIKSYKQFKTDAEFDLAAMEKDETSNPVSVEILNGKAEGLKLQVEEAETAIKAFVRSQSIREQKSKSEEERNQFAADMERIEAGIESVKEIRNQRMAEVQEKLRQPFQTVIGKAFGSDSFLRLSHNDKPCFEFGVVKNDEEIGFDTLSGGERAVVLPALVACIQIVKTRRVGLGLFELAEADDLSFAALIAATQAIGFEQVVVASCHGRPIDTIEDAVNIDMGAEAR